MIRLLYRERRFDYDIYSLTKAFFPTTEIKQSELPQGESEVGQTDSCLYISYHPTGVTLRVKLRGEEATAAVSREQEFSQSADWEEATDRSEQKNVTKRVLYRLWQQVTGRKLLWGTLSGIRPVKLFVAMLEEGLSESEIRQRAKETYLLSEERLDKALQIARTEVRLLSKLDFKRGYSLYVGLPFCPTICLYCSFGSALYSKWADQLDDYLLALEAEMKYISSQMRDRVLQTVYIGGGTPTVLSEIRLERLMGMLKTHFDLSQVLEMTVEAGRPDSITKEKLAVLYRNGVDRISINPQTMHDKTLRLIGRHHTAAQIEAAMGMAREVGFSNINMDLIAGLPSEGMSELSQTLDWVSEMKPESLTIHALAIKRASALAGNTDKYRFCLTEEDDVMGLADKRAAEMQLAPYYLYRQKNITGNLENIGYARAGCESLYNMLIMEEKQCIMAVGAGAVTKLVKGDVVERIENVKDVKEYLERIEEMIERKRRIVPWLNQ
ncbi:MAG: coproporphyrinogen dehydrogenase HemZ [Lachnospiraceae bacterium]|nr:coproporphyrinogen dehydrogenase HemZ [Lachnospiraceae bacterium]